MYIKSNSSVYALHHILYDLFIELNPPPTHTHNDHVIRYNVLGDLYTCICSNAE